MRELVISSPAKNALSTAVLEELGRGLADAAGEPLLLTGAGDVFSAGLDLREVSTLDMAGARRLIGALETTVRALFTYPGPTVALVNGHAIAGGAVLAACCDHRVATSDPRARIGLIEVSIGLPFPPVTLAALRARLSAPAADTAILGAQLHDPPGALAAGLVDEIAADARATALKRLEALARHPPAAYARAKRRLRDEALRLGAAEQRALDEEVLPIWASEETRASAARILARRGARRAGCFPPLTRAAGPGRSGTPRSAPAGPAGRAPPAACRGSPGPGPASPAAVPDRPPTGR